MAGTSREDQEDQLDSFPEEGLRDWTSRAAFVPLVFFHPEQVHDPAGPASRVLVFQPRAEPVFLRLPTPRRGADFGEAASMPAAHPLDLFSPRPNPPRTAHDIPLLIDRDPASPGARDEKRDPGIRERWVPARDAPRFVRSVPRPRGTLTTVARIDLAFQPLLFRTRRPENVLTYLHAHTHRERCGEALPLVPCCNRVAKLENGVGAGNHIAAASGIRYRADEETKERRSSIGWRFL